MDQAWQTLTTPEGKTYFWNTVTKVTQWKKPEALLTPQEKALANQPWKEYSTDDGRKYYYHQANRSTVWDMPEEYRNALAQASSLPARPPPPAQDFVAGSANSLTQYREEHRTPASSGFDRPRGQDQRDGFRSNFVPASTNEPDFATFEEAEAVFMKLLKRSGVDPDWTWEETMKAIIKDAHYRALKDPKDRKAAFEKYSVETRAQDKERMKERLAKLRVDFTSMLKSHPEVKHYTRWKTARPIIEGETIFKSASNDTERRQLFEEYIIELKKAHVEGSASSRKAALDELTIILKSLDLEPYTRWSEAQGKIQSNEKFKGDEKFNALTKSDVLTVFENHIKSLERTFNDARQLEKNQKARRERMNRDKYVALLRELKEVGRIRAGTKWMNSHPLIEDDPRYVAVLGQSGSTPLDLFWDMVEDEERVLRAKRNEVLDVVDDKRFEITPKTNLEEFMSVMQTDRRTSTMANEDLSLIFSRLHEKVMRHNEEDKHRLERQQRRAVDSLRSRIKHLDPPVHATDSWEDVSMRVEKYEEYRTLGSDELRRSAYEKVIRRLKDKETDYEQERSRRDKEPRNGHRRKHSRHSRTPEPDAYEADRKKAQADREKQYRKTSSTGLSPTPHDRRRDARDRDTRDKYEDRHPGRLVSSSSYDRGRRERDTDKDRRYTTRADPRESGASELDYGESGRAVSINGSTGRRRRDSEGSGSVDRRDSKRLKRDRRSRTPAEPISPKADDTPKLDDTAYKSGSEEGEIEED